MKTPFIIENLKSHYCKIVFAISLVIGYFLIPKDVLISNYKFIAIPFLVIFSLTMACTVRSIKERVKSAKDTKTSLTGLIASILGISTLQVCGLGAPACGASLGFGILAAIFPHFVLEFVHDYSVIILVLTILVQLISLYMMKCFVLRR